MPGPELASQVTFSGKLPPNLAEGLPEAAREVALPRGRVGSVASGGEGSSPQAHASAIQRIASGRPSRAADYLLHLQRSYGNRYVQRVLSEVGESSAPQVERMPAAGFELAAKTPSPKQPSRVVTSSGRLQPKLTIGAPDDLYEKEAEQVAEKVVVQRKCACGGDSGEECADCQMNRLSLQRVCTDDKAGTEAPAIVDEVLASTGQPLAEVARRTLEPGFGHDFSQVRVHDDSKAAASAAAVDAVAYTVGNHVVFGNGQYQPGTSAGNHLLAHELTHTIQQTGGIRRQVQRLSWDDVTNAVSSAEGSVEQQAEATASTVASGVKAVGQAVESGAEAVVSGAEAAGNAVASGAEAAGKAVVSGAEAAGSAVVSGAEAAGKAVVSGAEAAGNSVVSGAETAGKAVVSGAEAAGNAVVSGAEAAGNAVVSGAEDLALRGANAIAGLFGGKVTVSPSGGIVITIPDQEIAEVEDETFVLPMGIPTLTLFNSGFKVGTFEIDAWAGTIIGDPSVTMAIGPVRLQNINLVLDPGAGTYLGTAQLYIGSALSGSVEKAHEAKLQAEGVIPADPPIPILASAEVGLRAILRLVGKEGFSDNVTVGYAGGSLILRQALDVKLGCLANLDHEAFVRVEVEGEEICSLIWPMKSQRLGDAGIEVHVPVTIATGTDKAVTIGTPTAAKFPADAIETDLEGDHAPEHCMDVQELTKFLCDKGKVPPDICAILSPGKGGGQVIPGGKGVGPTVGPGGGGKLPAPGDQCQSRPDPCETPLPIRWPSIMPLPPKSRPLIRTPSKDDYISPDKRSAPQRRLQEAIKDALDRHRRGEPGVEVPRPCFKDDADPNAPYDAHHKQPLFLGGAEDDVNLCALRTDLHQEAHPRLNNQKDMLSHPVWIACRICSGQLPDHPGQQHYEIDGRK